MKGLWKFLIPFSPDTSGFASSIIGTDGIALFDDIRGCAGNYLITEEVRHADPPRTAVSEIADEDVITGTAPKVIRRFQEMRVDLGGDPGFVMLCSCPVSSLIGTDLKAIAAQITMETGIPASSVDFSGYESYDKGMRKTLTAMAKLLCKEPEQKRKAVNILGANYLDWSQEDADAIRTFCKEHGIEVQSVWGGNDTAEQFRCSTEASINWVVSAVGLDLAKWMKKEYGIPYISGAPFGQLYSKQLTESVRKILSGCNLPENKDSVQSLPGQNIGSKADGGNGSVEAGRPDDAVQVLIIGEQFTANALREELIRGFGFRSVQAAGFFTMDKSFMLSGDRKLKEESDLVELLQETTAEIIIGDPMMNLFPNPGRLWIPLPHIPVSTRLSGTEHPALLGEKADQWLRSFL